MKVKVKGIPVRYNGERYVQGDTLTIAQDSYNENLFEEVSDNGKTKEGDQQGHETQAKQETEGQSKARSTKGQKKKG